MSRVRELECCPSWLCSSWGPGAPRRRANVVLGTVCKHAPEVQAKGYHRRPSMRSYLPLRLFERIFWTHNTTTRWHQRPTVEYAELWPPFAGPNVWTDTARWILGSGTASLSTQPLLAGNPARACRPRGVMGASGQEANAPETSPGGSRTAFSTASPG